MTSRTINDLNLKDIHKLLDLNGGLTVKEMKELCGIECNHRAFRDWLHLMDIPFKYKATETRKTSKKTEVAAMKPTTIARKVPKPQGLKLKVGKKYTIQELTADREVTSKTARYEGVIIREYKRYYLGIDRNGIKFTLSKFPNCYRTKEI